MVLQIANVMKDRPELYDLLEQAYNDIYLPAFPIESERESLDKFVAALNGELPGIRTIINILGENLLDPETRVVKGISVAYYYEAQNVGLLAYNAIAPHHRERGMGKLMVDSRIRSLKQMARENGHKSINGVFLEVNDPTMVSHEQDSMDPRKRKALFEDWGARQVPISYVQPPLSAEGDYNDTMMLMNYPVDGKYCDKDCVENFLRAIYREFRADRAPDDDYFFRKMQKQLKDSDMPECEKSPLPGYKIGVPQFRFVA